MQFREVYNKQIAGFLQQKEKQQELQRNKKPCNCKNEREKSRFKIEKDRIIENG